VPAPVDQPRSDVPTGQSHDNATPQGLQTEPSVHPQSRPGPTTPMSARPSLAHTGSEAMLATSGASAALVAGGLILYRRGRSVSRR